MNDMLLTSEGPNVTIVDKYLASGTDMLLVHSHAINDGGLSAQLL